jgi:hypothetical protein
MARGWESKAVESQVQDFQSKDSRDANRQLTETQAAIRRRTEVLLLSRAKVQNDLQSSHNPRYREMLKRALAEIEAQLAEVKDIA